MICWYVIILVIRFLCRHAAITITSWMKQFFFYSYFLLFHVILQFNYLYSIVSMFMTVSSSTSSRSSSCTYFQLAGNLINVPRTVLLAKPLITFFRKTTRMTKIMTPTREFRESVINLKKKEAFLEITSLENVFKEICIFFIWVFVRWRNSVQSWKVENFQTIVPKIRV